jgi:iron complex transport system substrate-binding protein
MRICSFLPSATEILYALGAGDSVAGVTFECEYPPEVAGKRVIVHTVMSGGLTPKEIDEVVRKQAATGRSLYVVDEAALKEIAPELVITQDLCRVCAIGAEDLGSSLAKLDPAPQVISLEPHTLEDVFGTIETLGKAIGRESVAEILLSSLRARVARVASDKPEGIAPRVLCLEWLAPLYQGGHWVPEMVSLAGGDPVLSQPGARSVRLSWEQVFAADPEVILAMPCGFHLEDAVTQYQTTAFPEGWDEITAVRTGRVYAADGTAYFSCPSPRLVTGIEIVHAILQDTNGEDNFDHLPEGSVARIGLSVTAARAI